MPKVSNSRRNKTVNMTNPQLSNVCAIRENSMPSASRLFFDHYRRSKRPAAIKCVPFGNNNRDSFKSNTLTNGCECPVLDPNVCPVVINRSDNASALNQCFHNHIPSTTNNAVRLFFAVATTTTGVRLQVFCRYFPTAANLPPDGKVSARNCG